MTDNIKRNTYKGFELFNDIIDKTLRTRNRAVVLANIAEDNAKSKLISPKGAALVLGYFQQVPPDERHLVKEKFKECLTERGFRLV
jgi:hypothetical protein